MCTSALWKGKEGGKGRGRRERERGGRRVDRVYLLILLVCSYNELVKYYPSMLLLHCGLLADCDDGDVRLVNGTIPSEGRVELCFEGRWTSVCDKGWTIADAEVVCAQLGYGTDSKQLQIKRVETSSCTYLLRNLMHRKDF